MEKIRKKSSEVPKLVLAMAEGYEKNMRTDVIIKLRYAAIEKFYQKLHVLEEFDVKHQ